MSSVFTAATAFKLFEALADVAAITRAIENSVDAHQLTQDAATDISSDVAELTFLSETLSGPITGTERRLSDQWVDRCFTFMYLMFNLFTALEYLNGWGRPDPGEDFDAGQSDFSAIDKILRGANAQDNAWTGGGAGKYNDANTNMCQLVADMQDADQAIAGILQRQANQVQDVREQLATTITTLVGLVFLVAAASGRLNEVPAQLMAAPGNLGSALMDPCALPGKAWNSLFGADSTVKSVDKSANIFGLGGLIDQYLFAIVLTFAVSALLATVIILKVLIEEGRANAADLKDQAQAFDTAAVGAGKIPGSCLLWRPGIRTESRSGVSLVANPSIRADRQPLAVPGLGGATSGSARDCAGIGGLTDGHAGRAVPNPGPQSPAPAQTPQSPQPPPLVVPGLAGLGQSADRAARLSGNGGEQLNGGEWRVGDAPPPPAMPRRRASLPGMSGAQGAAFPDEVVVPAVFGEGTRAGHAPGVPVEVMAAAAEPAVGVGSGEG